MEMLSTPSYFAQMMINFKLFKLLHRTSEYRYIENTKTIGIIAFITDTFW